MENDRHCTRVTSDCGPRIRQQSADDGGRILLYAAERELRGHRSASRTKLHQSKSLGITAEQGGRGRYRPRGIFVTGGEKENIAVFFVHPTTFLESAGWNQPLDHAATNKRTDDTVMRNQASVFNGCCDVYAPRYRQATIFSFMDGSGAKNGEQALALAYDDVAAAFQEFLRLNPDRPIVLAGHSQGSHHLDRLIEEEVVGTALANRLVAAYPIGYSIDTSNGLPVCENVAQVGCQVTWNASAADAPVRWRNPATFALTHSHGQLMSSPPAMTQIWVA